MSAETQKQEMNCKCFKVQTTILPEEVNLNSVLKN
jgi:hypothetical protein